MKKTTLFLLMAAIVVLGFLGCPPMSTAGVDVSVGIHAGPPVYAVPAPPPVVLIPRTNYVYYVPDIDVNILFYHGHWYRPYDGRWYRSTHYNGPWGYLAPSRVPRILIDLPPDYRSVPPGHRHVPYGQLKKNWRRWEKERYWDKHGEWHDEGPGEHGGRGKGKGKGKGRGRDD